MPSNALDCAILFDMDGTLIDSEPLWLQSEQRLMAEFGYDWTVEDQIYCLGGPMSKVGLYMSERANKKLPANYFSDTLVDYVTEAISENFALVDGAFQLLSEISAAGIPMALVSASPRKIVDVAMSSGLTDFFPVSIAHEDVSRTKPDPEGYLAAARELQVDIHNSLIFEDSVTGVSAAIASGADVVAIPHITPLPVHQRVRHIENLRQLSVTDLMKWYPYLDHQRRSTATITERE